jgi:hypothetical protein
MNHHYITRGPECKGHLRVGFTGDKIAGATSSVRRRRGFGPTAPHFGSTAMPVQFAGATSSVRLFRACYDLRIGLELPVVGESELFLDVHLLHHHQAS